MNKRIFAAMAVAGLLFAGCSSNSSEASSAASGAGETSNTAYVEADGTEISATVTKKIPIARALPLPM